MTAPCDTCCHNISVAGEGPKCWATKRQLRQRADGHWAWAVNVRDGQRETTFEKECHSVPSATRIGVACSHTRLRQVSRPLPAAFRWYPVPDPCKFRSEEARAC